MKDPRVRRAVIVAAAAGCALLSLVFVLLAVDVVRSHEALASGDNDYVSAPKRGSLWESGGLGASTISRKVLGVDDDLRFREAVRALRLSQRDEPTDSSPEAILRRAKHRRVDRQREGQLVQR